jgi:cell wall-associated NlpC family hydrolase
MGLKVTRFARHLLGIPYRYGGSTPSSGFDCSGFVRFVYSHFGVNLPHSSYADFDLGKKVARNSLKPGDLVFFDSVGHVGMYIGNGRFIHAPHTGLSVMVSSLNDAWYASRYDGARRLAINFVHTVLPRPKNLAPLARWLAQAKH